MLTIRENPLLLKEMAARGTSSHSVAFAAVVLIFSLGKSTSFLETLNVIFEVPHGTLKCPDSSLNIRSN